MSNYTFPIRQKAYFPIKRLTDIVFSLLGIVVCTGLFWWWVLPINAVSSKGHPFFVHERIGKNKHIFRLIKFRSMKLDANPNLAPANMDASTQLSMETRFGRFLRKTSLDETPQLFNILFGQMSFIGPRPGAAHNEDILVSERESYIPNAYDVRPGLGGLAQLKMGRGHDPKEKARYDAEYAKTISIWLDIKLFFGTIFGVFGKVKGR